MGGANLAAGWASCPITQNGFVRVVTQPRYPNVVTTSEAIRLLRSATAHDGHAFWADDLSLLDPDYFNEGRLLGPKQLTDIYLLALAIKNGGRLATFDRSIPIAAVRGGKSIHIVTI